jgi:hypothetical protein
MIKTLKRKVNIDYSAPHNRQMFFRMRLLKFYKQIEFDEDIYTATATKILNGTLPYKYVNEIEKLRIKYEKEKKAKWEKLQKTKANSFGLEVRSIVKRFKK